MQVIYTNKQQEHPSYISIGSMLNSIYVISPYYIIYYICYIICTFAYYVDCMMRTIGSFVSLKNNNNKTADNSSMEYVPYGNNSIVIRKHNTYNAI
jgi:hypothetical protein